MGERGELADQDRAPLQQCYLVQRAVDHRTLHLEHDIGIPQRRRLVLGDHGARIPEFRVGHRGVLTGARFDDDLETETDELLDHVGRRRDPGFSRHPLLGYGDFHVGFPRTCRWSFARRLCTVGAPGTSVGFRDGGRPQSPAAEGMKRSFFGQ